MAELESFRLAAARLHLTPGAVSLLIKELETQLGFSVFDRTTRRVSLSKAGRDFLPSAQNVLREMQTAAVAAKQVRHGLESVVRVAAPLVLASSLLPRAIAAYQALHPGVMIRPVDCSNETLVQSIELDQADLAIGPDRPTADGVDRIRVFDSPWVLWCAPTHHLAQRRKITWGDLAAEVVIAAGYDYETHVGQAYQGLPEDQRFEAAYLVDNITTAFGMAAQGLGVTLAPSYVGVLATYMGLVMKRVEQPEIVRELSIYRSSLRPSTTAIAALLLFLETNLADPSLRQETRLSSSKKPRRTARTK